jgi:hypothetical protein
VLWGAMELVCDNSELNGIWGAEAPDVFVIGGYSIARDKVSLLLEQTQRVKEAHGVDAHCPIKWNLRDLDRALTVHGLLDQNGILLSKSDALRSDLLNVLTATGATLFVTVILAHSNKKQVLGKTREDLVAYSFGNLLMRAGLHRSENCNGPRVDVLLDWPERNDRRPFVNKYHTGWRHGRSGQADTQVHYKCGALAQLGFAPTPVFAGSEFEPRIQLADLVVGSAREFVNFALGKAAKESFGVQTFKSLTPHFYRRDNGWLLGLGLTVSPANSEFSSSILAALQKL